MNNGKFFVPNETVTVSEKQLLAAKIIEDESRFFHSEDKGCDIVEQKIQSRTGSFLVSILFCKTHEVDCCRCGWQIGYHFNTYSKGLSNQAPINL